jgi:coenzyme F420-reducing hydrogenase delta subunit
MSEAEITSLPRLRLKWISAAELTESINAMNCFTEELCSTGSFKLAAREMVK